MLYRWDSIEVHAIILATKNLKVGTNESKQILLKSIDYLKSNYVVFQKEEFMRKALWHICAYMKMGFSYEDGCEVFSEVLEHFQLDEHDLMLGMDIAREEITFNRTNISNILGRWNPVLHSMKIDDAVKDILEKTSKRIEGQYLYHCGRKVETNGNSLLWEHTFKLYVDTKTVVLHDINRNRYYSLKEKNSRYSYVKICSVS